MCPASTERDNQFSLSICNSFKTTQQASLADKVYFLNSVSACFLKLVVVQTEKITWHSFNKAQRYFLSY